jgi:hypothetical protein
MKKKTDDKHLLDPFKLLTYFFCFYENKGVHDSKNIFVLLMTKKKCRLYENIFFA